VKRTSYEAPQYAIFSSLPPAENICPDESQYGDISLPNNTFLLWHSNLVSKL